MARFTHRDGFTLPPCSQQIQLSSFMPLRKYSHIPGLSDGPAENLDGKIGFVVILLPYFF